MPETSPLIDVLLNDLRVSEARRRLLGMIRGELERALTRGALPVGAQRGLQRLLEPKALEIAECRRVQLAF